MHGTACRNGNVQATYQEYGHPCVADIIEADRILEWIRVGAHTRVVVHIPIDASAVADRVNLRIPLFQRHVAPAEITLHPHLFSLFFLFPL